MATLPAPTTTRTFPAGAFRQMGWAFLFLGISIGPSFRLGHESFLIDALPDFIGYLMIATAVNRLVPLHPPGARRPQLGAVPLVFDYPDDHPIHCRDLAVRQHHDLESAALAASDRLGPFRVGAGVDAVRAGGGSGAARRR